MRFWLALALSLCLGCGARTGLADLDASAGDADAGARRDGGPRRDAGLARDAGRGTDAGAEPCGAFGRWVEHPSPTDASLNDVFVVARDDAWIVGERGTILHWDGTEWTPVASPTAEDLASVWITGPRDGWITARNPLLRWNGDRWDVFVADVLPGIQALGALAALGPDDVWFGGGMAFPEIGVLYQWDGRELTRHESPTGIQVNSLAAAEDGSALWAVSQLGRLARRRSGGFWESFPEPPGETTTGIWSSTAEEAWASASHGEVHHYAEGRWTSERVGTTDTYYYAVWASSTRDVWVAGYEGAIAHFNGASWVPFRAPTDQNIHAIDGTCASDAWAVGAAGTILRLVP